MLIVDSSVWVDMFHGRETPPVGILRHWSASQVVGTGDLMVCEVLQGIRDEKVFASSRRRLMLTRIFEIGGIDIAVAAARNYKALRRRGLTVRGTIDCLIATFCIENDHILLHNDRDFEPF